MAKKPRKGGDPRKQAGGGGRTTAAGTKPKPKAAPPRLMQTPKGPMFPTQKPMSLDTLMQLDAAIDARLAELGATPE